MRYINLQREYLQPGWPPSLGAVGRRRGPYCLFRWAGGRSVGILYRGAAVPPAPPAAARSKAIIRSIVGTLRTIWACWREDTTHGKYQIPKRWGPVNSIPGNFAQLKNYNVRMKKIEINRNGSFSPQILGVFHGALTSVGRKARARGLKHTYRCLCSLPSSPVRSSQSYQ